MDVNAKKNTRKCHGTVIITPFDGGLFSICANYHASTRLPYPVDGAAREAICPCGTGGPEPGGVVASAAGGDGSSDGVVDGSDAGGILGRWAGGGGDHGRWATSCCYLGRDGAGGSLWAAGVDDHVVAAGVIGALDDADGVAVDDVDHVDLDVCGVAVVDGLGDGPVEFGVLDVEGNRLGVWCGGHGDDAGRFHGLGVGSSLGDCNRLHLGIGGLADSDSLDTRCLVGRRLVVVGMVGRWVVVGMVRRLDECLLVWSLDVLGLVVRGLAIRSLRVS